MAMYPHVTYVRVKDKKSGHEWTTSKTWAKSNAAAVDVIDKPAVNASGDPLPPKEKRQTARAAAAPAKKAAPRKRAAKKTSARKRAASTNTTTTGGASASKPEEGSK